jgi:zinc D-Ala-D-Ala carboxypeptidase
MNLSPNFTADQYTKSSTATRKNIDNSITNSVHLNNAKTLFINIVEKLYEKYGDKLIFTSGYRSPALNEAVGGSKNSQHSKGQAVDFEVIGVPNYELALWCKNNLDFDQLILEFYDCSKPQSGWVHVSFNTLEKNRKSVLTALKEGTGVVYHSDLLK